MVFQMIAQSDLLGVGTDDTEGESFYFSVGHIDPILNEWYPISYRFPGSHTSDILINVNGTVAHVPALAFESLDAYSTHAFADVLGVQVEVIFSIVLGATGLRDVCKLEVICRGSATVGVRLLWDCFLQQVSDDRTADAPDLFLNGEPILEEIELPVGVSPQHIQEVAAGTDETSEVPRHRAWMTMRCADMPEPSRLVVGSWAWMVNLSGWDYELRSPEETQLFHDNAVGVWWKDHVLTPDEPLHVWSFLGLSPAPCGGCLPLGGQVGTQPAVSTPAALSNLFVWLEGDATPASHGARLSHIENLAPGVRFNFNSAFGYDPFHTWPDGYPLTHEADPTYLTSDGPGGLPYFHFAGQADPVLSPDYGGGFQVLAQHLILYDEAIITNIPWTEWRSHSDEEILSYLPDPLNPAENPVNEFTCVMVFRTNGPNYRTSDPPTFPEGILHNGNGYVPAGMTLNPVDGTLFAGAGVDDSETDEPPRTVAAMLPAEPDQWRIFAARRSVAGGFLDATICTPTRIVDSLGPVVNRNTGGMTLGQYYAYDRMGFVIGAYTDIACLTVYTRALTDEELAGLIQRNAQKYQISLCCIGHESGGGPGEGEPPPAAGLVFPQATWL